MLRSRATLLFAVILLAGVIVAFWRTRAPLESSEREVSGKSVARGTSSPVVREKVERGAEDPVLLNRLSEEDARKLALLDEVLASKNDNDPRLDRELRGLSDSLKEKLREKYYDLAPEDRAGRGLIIFLLGRELKTEEDVAFLSEVVQEERCLSLDDCTQAPQAGAIDEHAASAGSVTLVYPQLVAIRSFEKALGNPALRSTVRAALEDAERYGPEEVARAAREAIARAEKNGVF